jgi:two-component system response regulator YesN
LVDVLMELKTKKDDELRQEQYNAQFAGEVQEYLTSSRRGFFDTLVSGGLSVSELLNRAEKLSLNLAAERYNIVLFLLEEEILNDNYFSTVARVQDEITQIFSEAERFVMFSAGMDVTAFLVKAGQDDIMDATQECVETLNRICQPLIDIMRWTALAGQPVSRLSSVADCYRAVRKALFYRGDDRAEKARDVASYQALWDTFPIDFDPDVFNADNMDFQIISKFLANGLQEDVDGFLEDYFNGFGPEGMKSVVFRHYIILNFQFAVNAFRKRIGADKIKYGGEVSKREVKEAIDSPEGLQKYAIALLSEALLLRDHAVSGQRRVMLQDVLSFMEENYADPEINLNTVAKVANVTPTHFSALFSQQMGKTFVEYLTELRMENARELLRCTGDGSGEIALKVGYNDPHYFSFLFKKVNGCSPRDYRNKVR